MSPQLVSLRAELRMLDDAILATESVAQEAATSFAWELSLNGLRARRKDLLADIRTALEEARVAELSLRFEGAPVQAGTADAGFLGEFLGCLQKLVSALGQAIAVRPTTRGTIPDSVMDRTRLRLMSVGVGSFRVSLAGDAHPNLLGEALVQECFDALHRLVDVGDDAGGLAEQLSHLGGRVQTHYTAFLTSLATSNASVEVETWLDATTQRTSVVTAAKARNVSEALSLLQREEGRMEQLAGQLIGLMQHRAQFEFRPAGAEQVIVGKVLPSALQKAALHYNQDIVADFSVDTIGVEGREDARENWTLADLAPARPG
jgi:hypothetical protein